MEPIISIRDFKGIHVGDDPIRLIPLKNEASYVVESVNVDYSSTGMPSRRQGATRVYSGNAEDIWADDSNFLFRDGLTLKRLTPTYTAISLGSLTSTAPLKYCSVNGAVYFTNGTDIGYLDSTGFNLLPIGSTTQEFRSYLPPGQEIEYYNGRLYVASGRFIYVSERFFYTEFDTRRNIIPMEGYITLLKAVEDGLFIADGKTHFASGKTPDAFDLKEVASYNATPGTAVRINGDLVAAAGSGYSTHSWKGKVLMWRSEKGICAGGNDGAFYNLTIGQLLNPLAIHGHSLCFQRGGSQYFLVSTDE